jgi:FtsH-binding integral membrane protein
VPEPTPDPTSNRTQNPPATRVYGWREVLLVGAIIVAIVLGISLITTILPDGPRWVIFQSPLAIIVIGVGTVLVLASLLRGSRRG